MVSSEVTLTRLRSSRDERRIRGCQAMTMNDDDDDVDVWEVEPSPSVAGGLLVHNRRVVNSAVSAIYMEA